jgi:hypothetical protein
VKHSGKREFLVLFSSPLVWVHNVIWCREITITSISVSLPTRSLRLSDGRLSRVGVTMDGVRIRKWMDVMTTYTHDSELQAITAPPLISTIHKSPQHPLSLFQPALSSPAVPWQRLLTAEVLHLHALMSYLHSLLCRPASRAELKWTKVEVKVMLRPTVSRPVCLWIKNPSVAHDQIFVTVRQLRVCSCGALSLTRGRVCCLQLLLALARAVILGSESRGTRNHILLSQIRDFPFRRLPRLAGSRWRHSTPPPRWSLKWTNFVPCL